MLFLSLCCFKNVSELFTVAASTKSRDTRSPGILGFLSVILPATFIELKGKYVGVPKS